MNEILLRIHSGQQLLQWGQRVNQRQMVVSLPVVNKDSLELLEKYGNDLYNIYLRHTLFEEARAEHHPLTLLVHDPDGHVWELMHDGEEYVALNGVTIVRLHQSEMTPLSLNVDRPPLRVLLTISSLEKTQTTEIEDLFQHLSRINQGVMDITLLHNPTPVRLIQAFDEANSTKQPFHLWHYAGHVSKNGLHLKGSVLTYSQLSRVLKDQKMLKGLCFDLYSPEYDCNELRDLLTGVLFLITPSLPLNNDFARLFFRTFYETVLVEGIDQAVQSARRKLSLYAPENSYAWAAMAFYKRTLDNDLFLRRTARERELDQMTIRDQIFVSYSHRDEAWCKRLMAYLEPLRQSHVIQAWIDTDIQAGSTWLEDIQKALTRAKVAILLVSPEFFKSSFIQKHELPYILEQRTLGNCRVIWVAVSAYTYEFTPLESIQAAHPPQEPLDRLSSTAADDVLLKVVRLVAAALKES